MRTKKLFFPHVVLFLAVILSGCTHAISREGLRQVDNVTFLGLRENPEGYAGQTVLLGGSVIEVENHPDRTEFVILHHDLGLANKPKPNRPSGGRFLVSMPQFLDPAIYKPGRWITVLGVVVGEQQRTLQETYRYPVVEGREMHLWPLGESVPGRVGFHFGLGVGFGL
jgi:outer membrane lipoprotein